MKLDKSVVLDIDSFRPINQFNPKQPQNINKIVNVTTCENVYNPIISLIKTKQNKTKQRNKKKNKTKGKHSMSALQTHIKILPNYLGLANIMMALYMDIQLFRRNEKSKPKTL